MTVRFVGESVELLGASPSSGFVVDVRRDDDEVEVRFVADGHESRIHADAPSGQPRIQVEERPGDRQTDDAPEPEESEGSEDPESVSEESEDENSEDAESEIEESEHDEPDDDDDRDD